MMNEMTKRILVALVGIPFAALIIWIGKFYFAAAVLIVTILALFEYFKIVSAKGIYPFYSIGIVFTVIIHLAAYISLNHFMDVPWISASMLLLVLTISVLLVQLFSNKTGALSNTSATISGVIYINSLMLPFVLIREFGSVLKITGATNRFGLMLSDLMPLYTDWAVLLFGIFSSIWICDTAAYFIGKSFGKHKLFERISPKKTWEGAIGGLFFGVTSFAIYITFLLPGFPIVHSIIIGFIIAVFGQLGDLAESQLKRDAGVKDSSGILPGHGGILDRFDSPMFAMPLVLLYLFILSFY